MTLRELSQLYYLNREIEMDMQKLAELELKRIPGSPVYDGMPPAKGRKGSRTERVAIEIADDITRLKKKIGRKIAKSTRERKRLEEYVDSIPDSMLRIIFTARFIDCLSWRGVADVIGGRNTPESVKKKCYRYLRQTENTKKS